MPATSTATPRSALRHRSIHPDQPGSQPPLVSRASRSPETVPPSERRKPEQHRARQQHSRSLLWLGSGMLVSLCLVLLGQGILAWWNTTWDTVEYGYPRTFQTDAFVGHSGEAPGSPSHLLALNLHGHVEIIEWPGGDATHAKIYIGPQLYGSNADRQPVTLSFSSQQHPDMQVYMQGATLLFYNTGTAFQLQALQR